MLRSGTKEPVPWRARGCLLTFSDIGTAGDLAVGQLLRRVLFSIQSGTGRRSRGSGCLGGYCGLCLLDTGSGELPKSTRRSRCGGIIRR